MLPLGKGAGGVRKIKLSHCDATEQSSQPLLYNEHQAVQFIGKGTVSLSFLRKARSEGAPGNRTPGPLFVKVGKRVFYRRYDLETWIAGLQPQRVV